MYASKYARIYCLFFLYYILFESIIVSLLFVLGVYRSLKDTYRSIMNPTSERLLSDLNELRQQFLKIKFNSLMDSISSDEQVLCVFLWDNMKIKVEY